MDTSTPEPMSAGEFRRIIAELELSQLATGRLFGIAPRTASGWALNQVRIPASAAILLRLMAERSVTERDIRRIGYAKRAKAKNA